MATTSHPQLENGKEETLEQRYIQLLERHVRLLEEKPEPGEAAAQARLRRLSMSVHPGQDPNPRSDVDGSDSGPPDSGKIQYRMKRFNEAGFQIEEKHDPEALEGVKTPSTSSVATFILKFDREKKHYDTEIKIESEAVRSIFQEQLTQYPGYHWKSPSLSLFAPFQPLIHHWDVLTKLAEANSEDEGYAGLKEILDAVKASKEVKEYFDTRGSADDDSVAFNFLWTIFPPGEYILLPGSFMEEDQVFIVQEASLDYDDTEEREYMAITCWAYDWDGPRQVFNRVAIQLKVESYKGKRLITSLPCFPLKWYTGDKVKLRQSLIDRGKRFRELCMRPKGKQMFEYSALAYYRGSGVRHVPGVQSGSMYDETSIVHRLAGMRRLRRSMTSESTSSKSGRPLILKGKVMVDFGSYVRHGPTERTPMGELRLADQDRDDECRCDLCTTEGGPITNQKYSWDANKGVDEDSFCDEQYLICPPRVLGYHLMEKKWVELQVTCVNDIEKGRGSDAFGKLELSQDKKELIEELVRGHSNDKVLENNTPRSKMDDLTKGKGEGLVILLHGPPGVGKTLTAESIAQATGKPLFPIGVGDVTTDPSLVEKRLEQLFELAEEWQAVMLFDEADVFLESRASTTDVTRVGLVSVLLRVLEYYRGILILTTNRIRSFDIAVQSRINLAIKFEDLTEKQKKRIFRNLVNQLGDEQVKNKQALLDWMNDDDDASRSFSKLNGRQVRNVVFSAASLAGNRKPGDNLLKREDIQRMLNETVEFQKHLHELTRAAREKNEV